MFWTLIKSVWTRGSHHLKEDVFTRYGRDKVPFDIKIKCLEHIEYFTVDGNLLTPNATHKNAKFQINRYNNIDDDDYIWVYRTFKVAKGKPIRKGVKKNSFDGLTQVEGSSFSYSFNKANSIILNSRINICQVEKYVKVNTECAKNIAINNKWLDSDKSSYSIYNDGFYTCVGVYAVKKKDIIFCTDCVGEDEIVINPNNVKLIDYRFLNIIDIFASNCTMTLIRSFNVSSRSSILNIDGVYDALYVWIKKYVDNKPKLIADIIMSKNLLNFDKIVNKHFYNNEKDHLDGKVALDQFDSSGVQLAKICLLDESGDEIYRFPKLHNGVRQRLTIRKCN